MYNEIPRPPDPPPDPERPPMDVIVTRRQRPTDFPPLDPTEETTEVNVYPNGPPRRAPLTEAQYRQRQYLLRQEAMRRRLFYVQKTIDAVWFLVGLLEILLGLRFIFQVAGARTSAGFIEFLYGVTDPFVWPFSGIFAVPRHGLYIFDPNVLVAMVIWAVVGWGINRLLLLSIAPPWEP